MIVSRCCSELLRAAQCFALRDFSKIRQWISPSIAPEIPRAIFLEIIFRAAPEASHDFFLEIPKVYSAIFSPMQPRIPPEESFRNQFGNFCPGFAPETCNEFLLGTTWDFSRISFVILSRNLPVFTVGFLEKLSLKKSW